VFTLLSAQCLSDSNFPEAAFVDAAQLFDGRPTFTYHSPRNDEDRWGTVGEMDDGKLYLVVWTKRNGRTRIIAAYRADDWEIRAYRALYGGTA
jgi:uncharacterized DUF497 family protein